MEDLVGVEDHVKLAGVPALWDTGDKEAGSRLQGGEGQVGKRP
jgi:hypothetical protein